MRGFVVDNEEEEGDEEEDDDGGGGSSDGDRKKKKKKKEKRKREESDEEDDELDDDDLDLMEENLGVRINREKKLKRVKKVGWMSVRGKDWCSFMWRCVAVSLIRRSFLFVFLSIISTALSSFFSPLGGGL